MRRKLRPALLLVVAALFALGTVASLGAAATAGGHGRRLQEGMGRDSFCDFLGADMISCGDDCVPLETCGQDWGCAQLAPAGSFIGCVTGECIPYWEDCPVVISIDPPGVRVVEGGEELGLATATYSVVLSEAPPAPLCIAPEPAISTGLSVSEPQLCFSGSNWDQPQQVTLSATEDDVDWGEALWTAVHHRVVSSSPVGLYRASCAASDALECGLSALLDGNGTACTTAGKCTYTRQVLARDEFCVAADQEICAGDVLNGSSPAPCIGHPLAVCSYTAPVEPRNASCVAVSASTCSAVNATSEGEAACVSAGLGCLYTAADAVAGTAADCVAADAANCTAVMDETLISDPEAACATAGNCSFAPEIIEVLERCFATDLVACASADLNGSASRCTREGECAHYPEVLPVDEACAAEDLAVCASVDVISVAADAGARDACTSAGACGFTIGVETSLPVMLTDNDVASVRMYGGPVGQPCGGAGAGGGVVIRQPSGSLNWEVDETDAPYICAWKISCPAGKQVALQLTGFETERQADYLTVWDGDASDVVSSVLPSNVLATLDGNTLPASPRYLSSGDSLSITFKSDGFPPETASLDASYVCGNPCCGSSVDIVGGYCSPLLGDGWVECGDGCARCDTWDNADLLQEAVEGATDGFDTYIVELNSPPQCDIVVVPIGLGVSTTPGFAVFTQVSFQWIDPDFLSRNPDFLSRNPDFLLKNVEFIIKLQANWSDPMVFTIVATDDPIAELGVLDLPQCDIYDSVCGSVGMVQCGEVCAPAGTIQIQTDGSFTRGPHRGSITHTIVSDDFVYGFMDLDWIVGVSIVTENHEFCI